MDPNLESVIQIDRARDAGGAALSVEHITNLRHDSPIKLSTVSRGDVLHVVKRPSVHADVSR